MGKFTMGKFTDEDTLKAGSRCKIGILPPKKGCFKVGQLYQILGFLHHDIFGEEPQKR